MVVRVSRCAYARAGLLGNPSDVYEGKTIAVSVCDFSAEVSLTPADRFEIRPGDADELVCSDFGEMVRRIDEQGCHDGVRLLKAAIRRFALARPDAIDRPASHELMRFAVSYSTTIPRQVGLSGSSAIVVAALRALGAWFHAPLPPHEMAEVALAAETEELGITAGPMDRVIQSYEGAVHMDFSVPRGPDAYTRLDLDSLPPLFLTWDPRVGEVSDAVHSDVRLRWLRGDADVRSAMEIFPGIVDQGMACLAARDLRGFRDCMDRNFDTRASIWKLGARDLEMIRIGRDLGAAVKLCGSGGAVVGALASPADFAAVQSAYRAAGYEAIRPMLQPPRTHAGKAG